MSIPQKVGLRRSSVEGNIPNASQINLGELAFNTKDGTIYFKDEADNIYDLTDKFTQEDVNTLLSSLTTDDIAEGDNQYFTTERARGSVSASGDLSYNTLSGEFSVTMYKSSDFDNDFNGKTTTDLVEGQNLYFTEQRARESISVDGDLSYSNGVISFNETYSNAVEIKAAYESNPNTNAFTDLEQSKLSSLENVSLSGSGATTISGVYPDITVSSTDTNTTYSGGTGISLLGTTFSLSDERYTTDEKSKLSGVESGATADQTAIEIKAAYESNLNTNAFTDEEKTTLSSLNKRVNNTPDPILMGIFF